MASLQVLFSGIFSSAFLVASFRVPLSSKAVGIMRSLLEKTYMAVRFSNKFIFVGHQGSALPGWQLGDWLIPQPRNPERRPSHSECIGLLLAGGPPTSWIRRSMHSFACINYKSYYPRLVTMKRKIRLLLCFVIGRPTPTQNRSPPEREPRGPIKGDMP